MRSFDMPTPDSLAEAISLLDTDDPAVRPFSGGTALMLMMKTGVFEPSVLVNLRGIEARYSAIEAAEDGGLRIGALASLRQIEASAEVARVSPVIPFAMKRLSNVRVRNVARIGGALAHGDPHMDMPPVLSALGARVAVEGPQGSREVDIDDLFTGYYETVLAQGELITEVIVPPQQGWRSAYRKVTTRSADDWPTLGIAVSLRTEDGGVADARVTVSAATEKVTRLAGAEAALKGQALDEAAIGRAGEAAMQEAETVEDARGSAAYKRELVGVYLRRAIRDVISSETAQ
jgi:carbon-monoxide dehydrogenase medium subunit